MNLSNVVKDKMKYAGCSIRKGMNNVLRALDEVVDGGGLLIVRVPTGYGKSTLSMFIASAIAEDPAGYGIGRVIHVLPLRSIVEDLYRKAKNSAKKSILRPLDEYDVAYQASIFMEEANKDQLFLSRLIYTTLDSYILNFAKITPLRTRWASYEAARAAIYTALTIFDEAHLFAEVGTSERGESRAYTSLVTVMASLIRAGLPVVVMTATVPDSLITRMINDTLPNKCLVVTMDAHRKALLGQYCKEEVFYDESWKSPKMQTSIVKVSEKYGINNIVEIVKNEVENKRRVLIVRNTVKLAVMTYKELKNKLGLSNIVLIHGRLSQGDRNEAIQKLGSTLDEQGACIHEDSGKVTQKSDSAQVIVATQVIEAGVDLDVDTLITDAAPLAQLVQRVGRVCRRREVCEGRVYVLHGDDYMEEAVANVYDKELVKESVNKLREVCGADGCDKIDWRIPNSSDDSSYFKLLNDVYRDYYDKLRIDHEVSEALRKIDTLVSLQRDDAENLMVRLCGFARDDIMVPIIVRECSEYSECLRNTVTVSLDFLNHLLNKNLIYKVLKGDGETLQVKYVVSEKRNKVGEGRDGELLMSIKDFKIHLSKLISSKGDISCGKMLIIDRIIANSIKDIDKDENVKFRGFIGFIARDDAYIGGEGFVIDQQIQEQ